ncbi:hypothetical protein Agub_g2293 [Astrephomene gubernaculifera]|uniref:Uncharacterized protein n=1 Tax=Astrephomene gubernaculifera TaxID=47775 RepID=A0AAD3DIY9_9CHLO|nr:hypothetical protein Agub_g2293 [Astrephomene gubernaculifera]
MRSRKSMKTTMGMTVEAPTFEACDGGNTSVAVSPSGAARTPTGTSLFPLQPIGLLDGAACALMDNGAPSRLSVSSSLRQPVTALVGTSSARAAATALPPSSCTPPQQASPFSACDAADHDYDYNGSSTSSSCSRRSNKLLDSIDSEGSRPTSDSPTSVLPESTRVQDSSNAVRKLLSATVAASAKIFSSMSNMDLHPQELLAISPKPGTSKSSPSPPPSPKATSKTARISNSDKLCRTTSLPILKNAVAGGSFGNGKAKKD